MSPKADEPLGSVRLYASGLGIILYSTPMRSELVAASSSEQLEDLYRSCLDEHRAVRIGTGSPQIYYELAFSFTSPPENQVVVDRVTFGLKIDDDHLSICDGYAELDWAADDYQHESIVVPSGYYRVDAYYLESPPAPRADMFVLFHLVPTSRRIDLLGKIVELIFQPSS